MVVREENNRVNKIGANIYGLRTAISNIACVSDCGPEQKDWVLVDTGIPFSGAWIKRFAESIFGVGTRPIAIILTHAHFDHVGGLEFLQKEWQVPVYVHQDELPYVTGKKMYPPPHPLIEKGMMSFLSPLYPRSPIDLGSQVKVLPADGTLQEMPGWKWVHTPGHTPGHVSLFREKDRFLLAGDAFITTKQESLLAVLFQKKIVHGPPAYFTQNWEDALQSIIKLQRLKPTAAYTGHGRVMNAEEFQTGLKRVILNIQQQQMDSFPGYVH